MEHIYDAKKRYISIKDNATGVKADDFIEDVGDIANSNKEIGKNKGFRGIGRLCGLAYCKTLKFTTSYLGESTVVVDDDDKKKSFVTSSMSKLSRSERKLVSKILSIITDIAPKDIAEQIIDKIKEEMR